LGSKFGLQHFGKGLRVLILGYINANAAFAIWLIPHISALIFPPWLVLLQWNQWKLSLRHIFLACLVVTLLFWWTLPGWELLAWHFVHNPNFSELVWLIVRRDALTVFGVFVFSSVASIFAFRLANRRSEFRHDQTK